MFNLFLECGQIEKNLQAITDQGEFGFSVYSNSDYWTVSITWFSSDGKILATATYNQIENDEKEIELLAADGVKLQDFKPNGPDMELYNELAGKLGMTLFEWYEERGNI